jgi:hypothetical protein
MQIQLIYYIKSRFPAVSGTNYDMFQAELTFVLPIRSDVIGDKFRALLFVLPAMWSHNIKDSNEFREVQLSGLKRTQFPSALNVEWRVYQESKSWIAVRVEIQDIDQLIIEPGNYAWSFPVLAPSRG